MEPLPPQLLPGVPHLTFGPFNLAVPNIIAWGLVFIALFLAAYFRLPHAFEPKE